MSQPQDWKITSVEPTTFDPDQYGNRFWQITLDGWNGALLWKTKAQPENNTVVFGHTEPSKSGKSMLFKKDQKEDGVSYSKPQTSTPTHIATAFPNISSEKPSKQDDITWAVVNKLASEYVSKNRPNLDAAAWANEVNEYAQALYTVYDNKEAETVIKADDFDGKPLSDDAMSQIPF